MIRAYSLFLLLAGFAFAAPTKEVTTVDSVDLEKYLGAWQELYRLPNSFQDDRDGDYGECMNTVARYTSKEDKVLVENTCSRFNSQNQPKEEVARAIATIVYGSGGSKLKVNFTGLAVLRWMGIGDGDYWVLGLGPVIDGKYSWALVGSPSRKFGWVLARKALPEKVLTEIFAIAETQGYKRSDFVNRVR